MVLWQFIIIQPILFYFDMLLTIYRIQESDKKKRAWREASPFANFFWRKFGMARGSLIELPIICSVFILIILTVPHEQEGIVYVLTGMWITADYVHIVSISFERQREKEEEEERKLLKTLLGQKDN